LKRGAAELVAALLVAMVVLGALSWMLAQWQKGIGNARKGINLIASQASLNNIEVDCSGNYLVAIDPSVPNVTDVSTSSTGLANVTYCYTTLTAPVYRAYITISLICDGEPMAYVIYGNFTKVAVNNVVLYQFHPLNSTSLVPLIKCSDYTIEPYPQLHIVMPNGLEKVAICFVNTTSLGWTVGSCSGV